MLGEKIPKLLKVLFPRLSSFPPQSLAPQDSASKLSLLPNLSCSFTLSVFLLFLPGAHQPLKHTSSQPLELLQSLCVCVWERNTLPVTPTHGTGLWPFSATRRRRLPHGTRWHFRFRSCHERRVTFKASPLSKSHPPYLWEGGLNYRVLLETVMTNVRCF